MGTIGSFDSDKNYNLNAGNKDTKVFIFIENINNFIPETDKSNTLLNERGMAKRFSNLFKTYKSYNCITTIFVHPTDSFKGRNSRETEPSYKDLGYYSELVDLGLCIYNPYAESNYKYFNYKINEFFINNKDRFRSVTVVKSNKSSAFITSPLIFFGENGSFREAPLPQMEAEIQEVQDELRTIGIPINTQ